MQPGNNDFSGLSSGLNPISNPIRTSTTTEFFRNLPQLKTLQKLLPRPEVIYVFGCANGAEVFSMAMVWPHVPDLKIFGFDLEESQIEVAKAGVFTKKEVCYYGKDLPEEFKRWFSERNGSFEVSPEIRDRCTFQVANLFDPFVLTLPEANVVTCQNLLIHLPRDLQNRAVQNLHPLTEPGGYLLLGNMDLELRETVTENMGLEAVTEHSAAIHNAWHDRRAAWDGSSVEDRPYWALEPYAHKPGRSGRYVSIFRKETTLDGYESHEIEIPAELTPSIGLRG